MNKGTKSLASSWPNSRATPSCKKRTGASFRSRCDISRGWRTSSFWASSNRIAGPGLPPCCWTHFCNTLVQWNSRVHLARLFSSMS
ncbi:unnamed protein product [Cyprideis torosa]|uniref:Uncharacterized protein n=1 Tax=Cyprideis torosa TaxID=163714 RepID=A0A7R8WSH4_9CRUS|nr:unnamed protein product [Cyprideis torosa]CAG0905118.1 unnamed protein product [Cyprideis torosa]